MEHGELVTACEARPLALARALRPAFRRFTGCLKKLGMPSLTESAHATRGPGSVMHRNDRH